MIRRATEIWRTEGAITLCRRTAGFLSRRVRRAVSRRLDPPPSVLYRWFELRSRVAPTASDANPMDLRWVDPDRIEYYQSGGPKRFGRVVGGEWDREPDSFEENVVARSVMARFADGVDWSETPLYREYVARMEDGNAYYDRRFETEAELEAYVESIDALYESITEDGYRTQRQLIDHGERPRDPGNDSYHPYLNEVTINVHRDGGLAKRKSGNHRLAIAKVHPAVDEIPVIVRVRHRRWQEIRDEIRRAESPTELSRRARTHLRHPDLADVVPESWTAGSSASR